ncbi:MAG: hypothetical protein OXN89_25160 [Bryobacterales bacterium]|nr:hypothetical protein [Bryobacterales bacterium]
MLDVGLGQEPQKYELPSDQRTGSIRQIYVVSHSHLDIGFTRPPDEVAREYKDTIDTAVRLATEHQDFRWTIESAWMLQEWLRRTDDQADIDRLGTLLREGRLALGVAFGNMHSGLMGAEESNRLVYLGHKLRKQFGIEAPVAFQNDVPGFSWAFPRVLEGSRVKYLVTGLNLFIGGGNSLGVDQNPFYWVGPDGSRVLTWFSYDSYMEGYRWNLRAEFPPEELEKTLPRRLAWLEQNGYRYDTYMLLCSPGDNSDPNRALGILKQIRSWNRDHPEMPMKMSTADEFFRYLTEKYGDDYPTASGDGTGHWATVKLRVPETTSKMRQASSLLPAAEAAATIASIVKASGFPRYDFAEAWQTLLTFQEHTTGSGPWPTYFSRWDTDWNEAAQYTFSLVGYSNAEQQMRRALDRLAGSAERASGKKALMVYNGLSWRRSGPVVVKGLPAALHDGPLVAVDLVSGEALPCEDIPNTKRHVQFFARDIPAVGYRMYSIEPAQGEVSTADVGFQLEGGWDESGRLVSILDRSTDRDLLLSESGRPFGGLYVAIDRKEHREAPLGPAATRVVEGPVSRRVYLERPGSALPLTILTTYREAAYADLAFDLDLSVLREESANHQAYGVALPLAESRDLFVDGAGFVARVPMDRLPGSDSPQYTPGHFTHAPRTADWGVTLANKDGFCIRPDMLFLVSWEDMLVQTREEGVQRVFRGEPQSSPIQRFRFRIAAQPSDPGTWKRFGAELNLPLRSRFVPSEGVPASREFFRVSHPNVWLLAFKPAESRPGWYMLRLQENSGSLAQRVEIQTFLPISEARVANTVEELTGSNFDLASFSMEAWQTRTVLVRVGE